ncbi:MAG: hypothetical protein HYU97_06765 [Deltaproteobacteria bacterium]|nr:hypothetical protein [Deltaproteobacteria bacterium]
MRTTVVLNEEFGEKIRPLIQSRKLSAFVNQCIREHLERKERKRRMKELEMAYQRASNRKRSDFEITEIEDWPEW